MPPSSEPNRELDIRQCIIHFCRIADGYIFAKYAAELLLYLEDNFPTDGRIAEDINSGVFKILKSVAWAYTDLDGIDI